MANISSVNKIVFGEEQVFILLLKSFKSTHPVHFMLEVDTLIFWFLFLSLIEYTVCEIYTKNSGPLLIHPNVSFSKNNHFSAL